MCMYQYTYTHVRERCMHMRVPMHVLYFVRRTIFPHELHFDIQQHNQATDQTLIIECEPIADTIKKQQLAEGVDLDTINTTPHTKT